MTRRPHVTSGYRRFGSSLLAAITLSMVLAACGPTVDGVSLDGTAWKGRSINNRATPEGKRPTIRFRGGQIVGDAICNAFSSQNVAIEGNTISIGNLVKIPVGCGGADDAFYAEQEAAFFDVLATATTIEFREITNNIAGPPLTVLVIAGPGGELFFEQFIGPIPTLR